MARTQPRVLARQPIGRNLVVGVRLVEDASFAKKLGPTRQALRSEAGLAVIQALARGAETPSALVAATEKSKYAVSQTLAMLKRAALVEEAPRVGADQRYRRYVVAWARFGVIFLQDHATALELFTAAEAHAGIERLTGKLDDGELRVLASGRLIFVRTLEPETPLTTPPARRVSTAAIAREFAAAFRRYFANRAFTTLRDHLKSFYEESARYADLLPTESALGDFMRFQKSSFARATSIADVYARGLADLSPEEGAPRAPKTPPVLLFMEAGREDATTGDYILHAGANQLVRRGVPMRIEPSYVYDPPGGGSWT